MVREEGSDISWYDTTDDHYVQTHVRRFISSLSGREDEDIIRNTNTTATTMTKIILYVSRASVRWVLTLLQDSHVEEQHLDILIRASLLGTVRNIKNHRGPPET